MKKILLTITSLTLLSCSSDENFPNPDTTTSNLIGVWKMERTVTVSGSDQTTVISTYLPDACKSNSTYEFKANGAYIAKDYNMVGTECKFSEVNKNYTYDSSTQKLVMGNMESKVLELTANKLVLYVNDNYDSNNDGINDYLKYTFIK